MQMLDLYSGLGGASEAFLQDHRWEIKRFENNPDITCSPLNCPPYTIHENVMQLPDRVGYYDFIWASPPCLEFSLAFNAPGPVAQRNCEHFEPDLSLMLKAFNIINASEPRYWCIENVIGAIKHFTPILGEPRQIIGPFVLWGNFPYLSIPPNFTHLKSEQDVWSTDPLRANKKGKIPLTISQAMLDSLTYQKSILTY